MPTAQGQSAGYSGTPLAKKLGLKEGGLLVCWNAPQELSDWLEPLPPTSTVTPSTGAPRTAQVDVAMVFATTNAALVKHFAAARKRLSESGGLWVCWPKKSSGLATELNETVIREFGLESGLVDNKVCAVSDIWSGLRFVVRVKDRAKPAAKRTSPRQQ
ncbi:MAG: DUF3052 domain-containing protein [Planctomycetota bacterium]|nr:DUF3052 domain-containing protein [Planctomycetota bacterium]